MQYLIRNDYKSYIQLDMLRQLTQGDDEKRVNTEPESIKAIVKKLTQKFDLDLEFTDLTVWDKTKTYKAGQRVYIDTLATGFATWVANTSYVVGAPVMYGGNGYYCLHNNSDATFTVSNWTLAGAQYAIFYVAFPSTCTLNGQPNPATLTQPYAPVFDYKKLYSLNDVVFWRNCTYVCNQASTVLTHGVALQYAQYSFIPYNNVFPDDPVANGNSQYWKTKTAYVIPVNTPLTDAKWIKGDNREPTIRKAVVVLTVFALSPLIAGNNVPDNWLDERREVFRCLNAAALGEITLDLPLKQPNDARRTYWGGNIKNINNY